MVLRPFRIQWKDHQEFAGFAECMTRNQTQSSHGIESKALHNFLFSVQSYVWDKQKMTCSDESTRMVYKRFQAVDERYE